MKKYLLLAAAVFSFSGLVKAEKYQINGDEKGIQFVISKNRKKGNDDFGKTDVVGKFTKFTGSFDYDSKTKSVKDLMVTVDVSSIDTDMAKRDKHLRSPDFFNVADHPTATFKSKAGQSFKLDKNGAATIKGNLTIKNKTKEVSLKVMASEKDGAIMITPQKDGYSLAFDRRDFGIEYNIEIDKDTLGGLFDKFKSFVGKNVIGNVTQINIHLTATKAK